MLKLHKTRRIRLVALLTSVLGLLVTAGIAAPSASATPPGSFLQNQYTGLCMSIPGNNYYNGAPVDQWGCGGYGDQYYWTTNSASHPGYYYVVLGENSSLCLTHNTPNNNAQLTVTYCGPGASQGNAYQLWRNVYDSSFGSSEMRSYVDDWCLSIPGASSAYGAAVNTWPCGPYPDQHWAFV
ncbi:RICIN domain-containing protein [Kitasatospora sp. NPDC001159]